MLLGELYQHKQQQSLQAYLSNANFLSEDRPQANLMNQSVASTNQSTQQDDSSLMMNTSGLGISTPKQASVKHPDESPKNAAIYNMQRQYYFGGAADQDT